jgi:hypothetical protein
VEGAEDNDEGKKNSAVVEEDAITCITVRLLWPERSKIKCG